MEISVKKFPDDIMKDMKIMNFEDSSLVSLDNDINAWLHAKVLKKENFRIYSMEGYVKGNKHCKSFLYKE